MLSVLQSISALLLILDWDGSSSALKNAPTSAEISLLYSLLSFFVGLVRICLCSWGIFSFITRGSYSLIVSTGQGSESISKGMCVLQDRYAPTFFVRKPSNLFSWELGAPFLQVNIVSSALWSLLHTSLESSALPISFWGLFLLTLYCPSFWSLWPEVMFQSPPRRYSPSNPLAHSFRWQKSHFFLSPPAGGYTLIMLIGQFDFTNPAFCPVSSWGDA